MKKVTNFLILTAFVFNVNIIISQTTIPDGTNASGTWDITGSPYIVEGGVIVLEDSTLIIEPGVIVKLKTDNANDLKGRFIIRGLFKAEGTTDSLINFTRFDSTGNWGSLIFYSGSDSSCMKYCNVEYGSNYTVSKATNYYGAISFGFAHYKVIENCTIAHNSKNGIFIRENLSSPLIKNCYIYNNGEDGILVEENNSPQIISNTITFNRYGIYCYTDTEGAIKYNVLSNNNSGIKTYNWCKTEITDNLILNNNNGIWASYPDGTDFRRNIIMYNNNYGVRSYGGNVQYYNNLIACNVSAGIYSDGGYVYIVNNTIVKNNGPAIKNNTSSNSFVNCIISNNESVQSSGILYFKNSLLDENILPGGSIDRGGNILGLYPQFNDTTNADYSLLPSSPCIDAGSFDTANLDSLDLADNPRLNNGRVDMGAYEYQQTGEWLHVVTPNCKEFFESATNDTIKWISSDPTSQVKIEYSIDDGISWEPITSSTSNDEEYLWQNIPDIDACQSKIRITNISDPIIADTTDGYFFIVPNLIKDEELVYGTWTLANSPYYIEKRAILPQGHTLVIEPGVEVKFRTGRNIEYNKSYFDVGVLRVEGQLIAEGTESDPILFTHQCDEGLWGVIYFDNTADTSSSLKNCNIEFANAIYTNDLYFGGISFRDASASVENCSLTSCFAGVVSAYNSSPTLKNNTFSLNYEGGVLSWQSSDTKIINNLFYSNIGYGIRCYQSSPALINNTVTFDGSQQKKIIHNRNFVFESDMLFKPDDKNYLYGLYIESNSNPVIQNSIIYGNGIYEEGENIYILNSSPEISFSLLSDEVFPIGAINAGYNLLNVDPKFIGSGPHPFSLKETSPCINTGNPDTTGLNLPDFDLQGNTRIFEDHIVDMGAYEIQTGQWIDLDLKVFLEGPYTTSNMSTQLNSGGYLPTYQPYDTLPWSYPGIDSVLTIPNSDIVDWVLVELRNSETGPSGATFEKRSAIQIGFLNKDGYIVDADGINNLNMLVLDTNNLYAIIYHRNHLPVMASFALEEVNDVYTYDFTSGPDKVYGGETACTEVSAGVWGMVAGDGNADGQVNNVDKDDYWFYQTGSSGYLPSDYNMDTQVSDTDKTEIWSPNAGSGSQIPGKGYKSQVPK